MTSIYVPILVTLLLAMSGVVNGNAPYQWIIGQQTTIPARSWGCSAMVDSDTMYILLGGESIDACGAECSSTVYAIDMDSQNITALEATGPAPSVRRSAACAVHSSSETIYVFGGKGSGDWATVLNDFYRYVERERVGRRCDGVVSRCNHPLRHESHDISVHIITPPPLFFL
jgi:hypothetical protein